MHGRGGHDQVRDLEVGLAVDDRNRLRSLVVGRVLVAVGYVVIAALVVVAGPGVGGACRIGDDVDVEVLRVGRGPADPLGQRERERLRVALAGPEGLVIAVGDRADERVACGVEGRVRREIDVVDPVLRAGPDRVAEVGDRPLDGRLLAGIIRRTG